MEQSFGRAIKALRLEKGLQQKYVALTSGLGTPRYCKIEKGQPPTDKELANIASAMRTDTSTLIRYWSGMIKSRTKANEINNRTFN